MTALITYFIFNTLFPDRLDILCLFFATITASFSFTVILFTTTRAKALLLPLSPSFFHIIATVLFSHITLTYKSRKGNKLILVECHHGGGDY